MVVSHDHRFLNRTSTHIIDVDYQRVKLYKGNYDSFLKQKAEHRERMEAEIGKREKEIADHKAFIARFKAKATKARQANSRAKKVEKIVINELPQSSRRYPNFKLKVRRPSGREVLECNGIWKAYGDKSVLEEVSLPLNAETAWPLLVPMGWKVHFAQNIDGGSGSRRRIQWGYEVDWGYFPQDHHAAMPDLKQSITSYLWDVNTVQPSV